MLDYYLRYLFIGCSESGFCYPPEKRWFEVKIAHHQIQSILPTTEPTATETAKSPNSEQPLASKSILTKLFTFYLLGILLAFTPCVLPMIPILFGV